MGLLNKAKEIIYIRDLQSDYNFAESQFIMIIKEEDSDYLFFIGTKFEDAGLFIYAIRLFYKAVEIGFKYKFIYDHLENIFSKIELSIFQNTLNTELEIKDEFYYFCLGMAYYNNKEYESALKYMKKSKKINSSFLLSYYGIGLTFDKMKKYFFAIRYIKKGLKKDKYHRYPLFYNHLVMIRKNLVEYQLYFYFQGLKFYFDKMENNKFIIWKILNNIRNKNIPIIYKYRELNDYTYLLLNNQEYYFSVPKLFNDPFDSYIELINVLDKKCINKYYPYLINKYSKNINDEYKLFDDNAINNSKTIRICCFSKNWNNSLMWAHYAKGHTGICIGFRTYHIGRDHYIKCYPCNFKSNGNRIEEIIIYILLKGLIPLEKISYEKKRTSYNIFNNNLINLFALERKVQCKGDDWKYEQEYRAKIITTMLSNNSKYDEVNALIKFDPKEIAEIIFGLNTPESEKDEIYKIVKKYENNGDWIKFYQCKMKKNRFEIERIVCL